MRVLGWILLVGGLIAFAFVWPPMLIVYLIIGAWVLPKRDSDD
jgi:hypothetical protein